MHTRASLPCARKMSCCAADMTTIATDGKTMAADTLITAGGQRVAHMRKVHQTNDGRIYACAGRCEHGTMFGKWLDDPQSEKPKLDDEFGALVMHRDGRVFHYTDLLEPVEFTIPQAIGSGGDIALGAMLHGASPVAAVQIAAQRDVGTGGAIDVMCCPEP